MDPEPRRYALQNLLEELTGKKNVYFQPPPNLNLSYPCIVYNLDNIDTEYADNLSYRSTNQYQVTVIDLDPDSKIKDSVAQLSGCSFERYFPEDNLNHFVFNLYF